MYRLKTLTGHSLWAREVGSQATEVAIRAACPTAWLSSPARIPSVSAEFHLTGVPASEENVLGYCNFSRDDFCSTCGQLCHHYQFHDTWIDKCRRDKCCVWPVYKELRRRNFRATYGDIRGKLASYSAA